MLLNKKGFPEEGELVLCKVTKVTYNSVFANIDEYKKSGMIHISEVSPGRIRNINDYVKEGKIVVCKVLNINKEKGYIDLSLRRVNDNQKRKKMDEVKQELKAEKIIEDAAKLLKIDVKQFYEKVSKIPIETDKFVYPSFEAVIEEDYDLSDLNLDKKELETLLELIKQRIKPKQVEILGNIAIKSFKENGIETIKKALSFFQDLDKEKVSLKYLGSGKFRLRIVEQNYIEAEAILKKGIDFVESVCKKEGAELIFERIQQKK
jgi:translation initiation factor 2 subunit 1